MYLNKPLFLLLLLLIPLLYFLSWRRQGRLPFSYTGVFKKKWWRKPLSQLPLYLLLLSYTMGVIALARPQKGITREIVEKKGIDIVIALDISSSMLAEDFRPQNRIQVAKDVAARFIAKRQGDRIGLVVFAKGALMQCPLTIDHGILLKLLKQVDIGMLPDGTAIGMGIGTALVMLENSRAKEKVIVLLTDGRNKAGKITPDRAAEMAKEMGVKIYTVAIGKRGPVPFPVIKGGIKTYVMARFDVNDSELMDIAEKTGGKFFTATSPTMLRDVMETINKLQPTRFKIIRYKDYREKMNLFLIPAILLLALYFIEPLITRRLP
ncbi:MAG TPA: VWA domain-containing protein [candidate division WOR-3 bacterium]|uniref:VWA domain-containing protein n=1 Tax=candidate division WOR-3 bacterium TaxID=2052148 RepID=A0A7C0VDC3_UNCW3|nr:VWA domain-containing protein [candidate division WOR-3 bacterium]